MSERSVIFEGRRFKLGLETMVVDREQRTLVANERGPTTVTRPVP
jgi:hypothetical protein